MRNLKLGIIVLIGLLAFTSCSNKKDTELSNEELLVQNSPWTYDRYELINIVDPGNGNFTAEDWINNVDSEYSGTTVVFNEDGTGLSTFQQEQESWEWLITDDNKLRLIFSADESATYDFSISSEEFAIEILEEAYVSAEVHGKYIYK